MYNEQNIFAKIIRGELQSKKIYEDENLIAIYDINPKSRIHALVIPKKNYIDFSDFMKNGSPEEIGNFFQKANFIGREVLSLTDFRLHINNGKNAGQEVFHFHLHILG